MDYVHVSVNLGAISTQMRRYADDIDRMRRDKQYEGLPKLVDELEDTQEYLAEVSATANPRVVEGT